MDSQKKSLPYYRESKPRYLWAIFEVYLKSYYVDNSWYVAN